MKILFCLHSINYDRHFEDFLRATLDRGHSMHVTFDVAKKGARGDTRLFDELGEAYPRLSWGPAPRSLEEANSGFRSDLRFATDYVRFLDPRFAEAHAHRERARERTPVGFAALAEHGPFSSPQGRDRLDRIFRMAEHAMAPPSALVNFIRSQSPDVIAISPLVGLGSAQGEYVRAARALGIPCALLVASWDNLTNKGIIRDAPDRTIVWNGAQVEEAVELHSLDRDRVVAVGAHTYDHWFGWRPSREREAFCKEVGLDPARPFLLYTGSSGFVAPHEPEFVREWVQGLRASAEGSLSTAGVLVRPHPTALKFWTDSDFGDLPGVVVWPREGHMPNDDQAKRDYFDSIHHGAAVVGINTSALVEAAIVGRPVHTVLTQRYRDTQEGAVHFNHLVHGPLVVSPNMDDHVRALAGVLDGDSSHVRRNAKFLATFVRPRGLDRPAAPLAVDALEEIATQPSERVLPRRSDQLIRASLRPVLRTAQYMAAFGNGAAPSVKPARTSGRRGLRSHTGDSLRILFCLDHPGILIHFDSTVQELARRGHEVRLAFLRAKKHDEGLEALDRSSGRILVEPVVPRREDAFSTMAYAVRATADFSHYLDPALEKAEFSREKWRGLAELPLLARPLKRFNRLPHRVVRGLLAACAAVEDAIPPSSSIGDFLDRVDPDVVLVSPLIQQNSYQTDLIKTARAQGRSTALCVASWDNLTSKGMIRVVPDRITLWNRTQREEAIQYQGVPESRILVTGAQNFDRWYERKPRWSAEEFRRQMGLPPDKPHILFVGSSLLTLAEDDEEKFCRRWLSALRNCSDPKLRDISVVVRPHPRTGILWKRSDLSEFGNVHIWRREMPLPVLEGDRAEYYDSIYHAAAVVGLNSSALLEAAIIGRPAYTVLVPEFADLQTRLIHFNYMLSRNGGFLREAESLEQHLRLLSEDLRDPERVREMQHRFVDPFIRPNGVDRPAMPFLVDAIESLPDAPIAEELRPGAQSRAVRTLVAAATFGSRAPVAAHRLSDSHGARAASRVREAAKAVAGSDGGTGSPLRSRMAQAMGTVADRIAEQSLESRNWLKRRGEPLRKTTAKEVTAAKRSKAPKHGRAQALKPPKAKPPKTTAAKAEKVKAAKRAKAKAAKAKAAKAKAKAAKAVSPKAAKPREASRPKPAKAPSAGGQSRPKAETVAETSPQPDGQAAELSSQEPVVGRARRDAEPSPDSVNGSRRPSGQ